MKNLVVEISGRSETRRRLPFHILFTFRASLGFNRFDGKSQTINNGNDNQLSEPGRRNDKKGKAPKNLSLADNASFDFCFSGDARRRHELADFADDIEEKLKTARATESKLINRTCREFYSAAETNDLGSTLKAVSARFLKCRNTASEFLVSRV